MNIHLHTQILRRHWVLLAVGFGVAVVLAAMTALTIGVSPFKVSWKVKPVYGVRSVLMVTQPGFPEGQAAIASTGAAGAASNQNPNYADPSRYNYLAGLYAQLASSDAVINLVLGKGGFRDNLLHLDNGRTVGGYSAQQLNAPNGTGTLPFVQILATSESPIAARRIATVATDALMSYVSARQSRFGIVGSQRVELARIVSPTGLQIVKARGLVRPLAVFVLCFLGAVGLVYLRENFKREKLVDEAETRGPVVTTAFNKDPPLPYASSGVGGTAHE